MRKYFLLFAASLLVTPPLQPANAWFHAGGWGAHGGGFDGRWGAVGVTVAGRWVASLPTGHAWGAAGNASGWRGASTRGWRAGGNYNSWSAVGPNGHWATGNRYYGGTWRGVHSPVVVNSYYGGAGCWDCGGWGAAAGVAAGRCRCRRGRGRCHRRGRHRRCGERLLPGRGRLFGPAGWMRLHSI
jgi:hypothetical protein